MFLSLGPESGVFCVKTTGVCTYLLFVKKGVEVLELTYTSIYI